MRHTDLNMRTKKPSCKRAKSDRGFTLIEIAVSMMVIGLLIAPAIAAYNLYIEQQKIEHTKTALDRSSSFLSGFLDAYGRYPCPAPMDKDVGDPEYGYEDCTATSPGIITAQSARMPPLANPNVLIGSIPFRTLNLDQDDAMDGYHSRLTYAVTEGLTDSDSYFVNEGGIGVRSNAGGGDSAISPENSAHFVIISHGKNGFGAITETGVPSGNCASGSALEQENCDYLIDGTPEATFLSTHKQADFDDVVTYYMGRGVSPWQYQKNNTNDIHLRRGDTIVSGDTDLMTSALASFQAENIHIRAAGGDADGIIRAQGDAGGAIPATDYTGTVRVNNLCGEDISGDGCFSPELLSGGMVPDGGGSLILETITGPTVFAQTANNGVDDLNYGAEGTTGGISCHTQEVMVGIKDGKPLCSKTVEFNCPTTPTKSFLKGVDSNGKIICDGVAPAGCAEQSGVANSCGGTFTLPEKPHYQTHAAFSGTCYMIENFDDAYADSQMVPGNFAASLINIQNYVDTLNTANRTVTPCETASDGLVRDAYRCDNGSWNLDGGGNVIPDRSTERGDYGWGWPSIMSTSRPAETISNPGHTPYPVPPADPMSVDSDNSDYRHDCWCREDYRVSVISCADGVGDQIRVDKHRCPQTYSKWQLGVWTSSESLTCTCVPQDDLTGAWGSCEAYYSAISGTAVPANSMDGDVDRMYDLTCPGYVEVDHPMNTWNTNSCTCPNRSDLVPDPNPEDCPTGFTNSFTYEGVTYTDKKKAVHKRWICPGPNGKGGLITNATDYGYWNTSPAFDQACTCDASATSTIPKDCDDINPQWTGPGATFKTVISCPAGTFSEPSPPVPLGGECFSCTWQPPGGSPTGESDNVNFVLEGESCNCNSFVSQTCGVRSGAKYDTYTGCSCEPTNRITFP